MIHFASSGFAKHIVRVIPLLTEFALAPIGVSACFFSFHSQVDKVMIGMIWANDEIRVFVIGPIAVNMMYLSPLWERFP